MFDTREINEVLFEATLNIVDSNPLLKECGGVSCSPTATNSFSSDLSHVRVKALEQACLPKLKSLTQVLSMAHDIDALFGHRVVTNTAFKRNEQCEELPQFFSDVNCTVVLLWVRRSCSRSDERTFLANTKSNAKRK